ncbi:MAG: oxidoreductase [Planctomycetota bacterium]|nr:MAG: oxidoreductase [Planctomycetota bacterium]
MAALTPRWSRRDLLKTTAAALPAWFVESSVRPALAAEKSPNARPRVALVGCGGMGQHDARLAKRFGDVVAVCDVDAAHLAAAAKAFKGAEKFSDYRKVCDAPNVDVIINATPDHWHTLINLRAVRSGKDVYAEKPLTLTIDEGKRLVAAVKESGRILQVGSQQRSDATFRLACELVRNGRLGKIERVRTWLPSGLHDGPFATAPAPPGLDWDFWQGQTQPVDYVPQRCHQTFRYWYDYSGGTMTDWGAHHNDIALWGLGKDRSGPVSAEGRPLVDPIPGGYTAPSQYEVKFVYDDGVEHFCRSTSANTWGGGVQGRPGPGEKYHGVQFEGADGWLYVTRGGKLEASDPDLIKTPLPSDAQRLYASDDHMANFFECIATRDAPICDVEIGHRSVSCCHVGVIAIRLGRQVHWNPDSEQFVDDDEANAMVAREQRQAYSYETM